MHRSKTFAACLAASALLLGACGGSSDNSSSPLPGGNASGGGGEKPEGEPIVIGLDEDSTSAGAAYSVTTSDAIRDVVDKINSEGGILDRPVELVVGNSESDPTKGSAVARQLVDKGAVAVFLTAGSSASIQMKPVLQSEKVVAIAPTATNADLLKAPDADYVYTMAPSAATWAPIYCGAFEEMDAKKVAVMTEGTPVIAGVNEALIDAGIDECVDVVAIEEADPDATDVTAQITKLKNAKPDAILVSTSGGPYEVLIHNTLAQVVPDVPRFTVYSLANQPGEWRSANPGALEGLVALAGIDLSNERTQEAIDYFTSVRGEDDFKITGFEAQAYDSVYLLKEAIEAAGSVDDPEAIKDALDGITDYEPHFGLDQFRLGFAPDKHNAPEGTCGILLAEFTADNELGEPWETFQPEC